MILSVAAVGATIACGGGEQRVVNQYFGAVNAQDNQTLTSFSMANFNRKVDRWKITGSAPETRRPANLPELVQKVKDLEAQAAANKKAAQSYANDHADESVRYKDAMNKGGKVPPGLAKFADELERYNAKDRELRKGLAEAKAAVERERRAVTLSVGNVPEVDSLTGEAVDKPVEVELTLGGEAKPYVMMLRKYDLSNGKDKVQGRWIVLNLSPKA
jgi:hypothetical protein